MTTTMTFIKRFLSVLLCCLVVVFSFTFTSSAVIDPEPIVYKFAVPNPADNFDGYIVVPNTSSEAWLLAWNITSNSTYESNVNDWDIDVNVHFSEHKVILDFISTDPNEKYIVTVYYIVNGEANYIERLNTVFVEYNAPYQTYIKDNDSSFICANYFKGVTRLTHDNYDAYNSFENPTYSCIFSDYINNFDKLEEIITYFNLQLLKMDLTNEHFSLALDKMNEIYESVVSIDNNLNDFIFYYWDEFVYYHFPQQIGAVCSRLDKIYKLLNQKGETEQTTVNSDNFNEFNDLEQGLIDNPDANNAIGSFDVSIDGGSYSFIWTMITDFFSSHSAVIGLVIALLTLGFIALILNR